MNPYGQPPAWGQAPPPANPYGGYNDEPPMRFGPPWEVEGPPFLTRWWDTVRQCIMTPSEFYSNMRTEGDYVKPMIFLAIGGAIQGLGQLITTPFSMALASRANTGSSPAGELMRSMCMALVMPLLLPALMFISAGIVHVGLMVMGGANKSFEATYRTMAYATGSLAILSLIPCLGSCIAGIWALVSEIIGLAKAHETDIGRAAGAVLLPTVLCCGLAILAFMVFGVAIFAMLGGAAAAGGSAAPSGF